MSHLIFADVLAKVESHMQTLHAFRIAGPSHPDYGGIVNPDFGIADPKATERFIACCAYFDLMGGQPETSLWESVLQAADFMLWAQRPSGLIDLLSTNYDSSPDTGFAVQVLCPLVRWGRERRTGHPQWSQLLEKLERFIRRAVPGILSGGFHTPNHRWVITSALVQAHVLFPDLDVESVVTAYLAEGFDIDGEGTFIERSAGVYDAVNDRSLAFIDEFWDAPGAVEAIQRNLDWNLHLLHSDGTVDTGLSRRQDYGKRPVPAGLIDSYLRSHQHSPNPVFVKAAQMLWEQSPDIDDEHLIWVCYALLKCDEPPGLHAELPTDFSTHYPLNGLWRVRRDLLSASVFKDTPRLLTMTFGDAELTSLKINQSYFGPSCGGFVADEMQVDGNVCRLRSEGQNRPRRPGYEQPLGKPVPPSKWSAMAEERSVRELPPALSTLTIQEVHGGFDLHYQTLDGLEGVTTQVAFDFPPGGIWETEDSRIKPVAGQEIFFKHGTGEMRYGTDLIQISPGASAHGMWQMRGTEPAPEHVRVLLTFLTPIDCTIKLRGYRGYKVR